jgi:myo-inositol 2-dehydrogenase/D-chiro-inositol 1-dehydrogenase
MSEIRLGILGTGFMGGIHARALRDVAGARLIAACDPDRARLEDFGREHGVDRLTTEPAAFLDTANLDLVIIATPNAQHAALAATALSAGKHVLVEKPLALTLDETRTLQTLALAHRRVLAYGENLFFAPKFRRLRELAADDNGMGRVYHQRHVFETAGPDGEWWLDPSQVGGGAMLDLGCHLVSLCCWIYRGSKARAVTGHSRTVEPHRCGVLEDFALAWLEFEDGRTADVRTSWLQRGGEELVTEVLGTKGFVRADLWKGMGLSAYTQGRFSSMWEPASGWVHPEWEWIQNSGYPQQLRAMIHAIVNGGAMEADCQLWQHVLEILLAVNRSARTGRTVSLPLDDGATLTLTEPLRQSVNE